MKTLLARESSKIYEYKRKIMKRLLVRTYHWLLKTVVGNKAVFNDIYRRGAWYLGNNQNDGIYSGSGSLPENSTDYENFVAKYIIDNKIKSFVDIGCGDFQVAKRILEQLPSDIDYLGIDASSLVVARNEKLFKTDKRNFKCLDAVNQSIPSGDLVLCREVLQHLSNQDILKILPKFEQFKFCLLTNTIHINPSHRNADIGSGTTTRATLESGLWMNEPPFNLPGEDVLITKHTKQDNYITTFERHSV